MKLGRILLVFILLCSCLAACSLKNGQAGSVKTNAESTIASDSMNCIDELSGDDMLERLYMGARLHDPSSYLRLAELYSTGELVRKDSLLADFFLSEIEYYSNHGDEASRIIDSTIYFWRAATTYYDRYVNSILEEESIDEFIHRFTCDIVFQRDRTILPYKEYSRYKKYDEYFVLSIPSYDGKTEICRVSDDSFCLDLYKYQRKYVEEYRFIKIRGEWFLSEISSFSIPEEQLPARGEEYYSTVDYDAGSMLYADMEDLKNKVVMKGDLDALKDISVFHRDSLRFYSQILLDKWHKDEAYDYLSSALFHECYVLGNQKLNNCFLRVAFEGAKRKMHLCLVHLYCYYFLYERDKLAAAYFSDMSREYPDKEVRYNVFEP